MAAVTGNGPREITVAMPPQHGKSSTGSMGFPAWVIGNWPDTNVMLASYEASFAATWGAKTRDILADVGDAVFGVHPLGGRDAARNSWKIAGYTGGMFTTGFAGGGSGRPADIFIVDDPFKNFAEARSAVIRDARWDWFRSVAYPRRSPGAPVFVFSTRWHEDDVIGRIKRDLKGWLHVTMPAIDEKGQGLWTERYSLAEYVKIQATIGPYLWGAMYQGNPMPEAGNLFKRSWFRYYHREGEGADAYYVLDGRRVPVAKCRRFQTCDPAASIKPDACYFTIGTWDITPEGDVVVVDILRERIETVDHGRVLHANFDAWAPLWVGVERASFGMSIINDLKKNGFPVKPLEADADKVSRALPATALYNNGSIWHPLAKPWVGDFERELIDFPHGRFKDQVDILAYAVRGIRRAQGLVRVVA